MLFKSHGGKWLERSRSPVVDDGDEEDEVGDERDGREAEVHGPPPSLGEDDVGVILVKVLGRRRLRRRRRRPVGAQRGP